MLEAVGISQLPLGVVNTTGICDQRAKAIEDGVPVYGRADQAYRLTQRAVLTVSTAQVFQGKLRVDTIHRFSYEEKYLNVGKNKLNRGIPR